MNELVYMNHQSLTAPDDELVHTGDGVRSDLRIVVSEKCEKLKTETDILSCSDVRSPDLGYEDVKRSVEAV